MTIVDELTGLYNRTGFLILADHHLKLSDREKKAMTLLIFELDGLGSEQATRRAVAETGEVIKETLRASDVFGRVEEQRFCVLLTGDSAGSADVVLARLVEAVATYNARELHTDELSVRVGRAPYDPADPCSIEDLMERADRMMRNAQDQAGT